MIGDVLSLDLAMPAALRARDPNYQKMRVILKRQRHTPSWVLRACQAWGIAVSESLEMIARSL